MAELYFQHESDAYIFDTNMLKLFRWEADRSVEINNLETIRNVRLYSAEISREQAFKLAQKCQQHLLFV